MRVVQCTFSGIDGSGFAWSNVFHISTDQDGNPDHDLLTELADDLAGTPLTRYKAAANADTHFLDIATKVVGTSPTYTYHKKISEVGSRAITAALGAVCPLIRFFPSSGTIIGGMYAVGAGVADFVLDEIQPAYQGLLEDLADGLLAYDGSVGPWNFQLCTYNPHGPVVKPLKFRAAPTRPTTLNKRVRA